MKRKTQEKNKRELKKFSSEFKQENKIGGRDTKMIKKESGITLIALAISRKCVRYEERAWKPCERREKERKV